MIENTAIKHKKLNLRRLKALLFKEALQIRRDPSSLLITIFIPLLLLFIYGYGVSLDLDHLRIALVLEDTSPEAQSLRESFSNSPYFDVKVIRDRRECLDSLIQGTIRGFVVVPSYFTQFLHRKETIAPVQVIADGSETNTANFVQNYARGAFIKWMQQQGFSPQIRLDPQYWYNKTLESRFFLLSGSLAIIMTLIGAMLTALVVAKEWERGTMEMMMSTNVTITELILGKTLPYFILSMLSMVLSTFISTSIFGLPLRGSFSILMLVSAFFSITSLSMGLLISTLMKNQIAAYQTTLIAAFLPSYMLSGFLFEIQSMPAWIKGLTYFIPAKYFVQSLQTLFLVGNVWPLIWLNLIPMILISSFFFTLVFLTTQKRLD